MPIDINDKNKILKTENWLYFKIYQDPTSEKWSLDWYHEVLRKVIKPFIDSKNKVGFIFFTVYGPEPYSPETEDENFIRKIEKSTDLKLNFIRLRAYIGIENKNKIEQKIVDIINKNSELIWDYEILKDYNVRADLLHRIGAEDEDRTILFIRYWDAGCRYILSIIAEKDNWEPNVEVWLMPHLINNGLGGWIRHPNIKCKECGSLIYFSTDPTDIPPEGQKELSKMRQLPILNFICKKCHSGGFIVTRL